MTLRSRWLPASGATVRFRAPVSAMARISGTLIGSMRMEEALMLAPMRCKLDGQFVDLRVIADRGADQADLGVPVGHGLLGRGQQAIQRLLACRAIDIAGQAEATAAAAAACDLHQVHVAEFGVGRVERARCVEVGQVAHPEPLDRAEVRMLAVGRAQTGHIPAGRGIQRAQQCLVIVDPVAAEFDKVRHRLFALADEDGVEEGRHRLRVHGHARPAGDQQRPRAAVPLCARLPVGGQRRHAGLAQHFDDVEVVHLPRDGEGPDVELVGGAAALQREQRLAGLAAPFSQKMRSQTTSGSALKVR